MTLKYELSDLYGGGVVDGSEYSYFDEDAMLAILLYNDVIFSNSANYRWIQHGDGPATDGQTVVLFVLCNDTFAYSCADAQDLPGDQIEPLFRLWHDKGWHGVVRWCAKQRNQKPIGCVIRSMKDAGDWDDEMESLGKNTQNAEVQATFDRLAAERSDK